MTALWALAMISLLAVVGAVGATGCGSDTQASPGTTASTAASGQTSTGQTTTGQNTDGRPSGPPGSMPAGFAGGARPSGGPGMGAPGSESTTTTTQPSATTTTQPSTTTTSLADDQHGDGIYKAGTDIDSGLYTGTAVSDTAHWEITSDASGVKFVASGDPTGPFYIRVTSGQYVRLEGVIIEEASGTATDPLAATGLTDGTYRVGYDIEAGWYAGTLTGDSVIGYWQISSDANGQKLTASDYPRGSFTFKVTTGQYLTLRGVTVSLQE